MPHIRLKLGHYLTCDTNYAVAEAEDIEEQFRLTLELSDNIPQKADLLENCGDGFLRRFLGNTNRKEDIDNCILAYELAVHLTPQGHSDMSRRLNMLGTSFSHRYEGTGDLADISDAISYQQKAVHLTPEGHADIPRYLNNLGASFQSRFERTGDLADVSDAISYQQKSVHLTPEGHPDIANHLNNLGISFNYRFGRTGELGDISDAISCHQKALHLTPEGHADMHGHLNNLGNSLQSRFERTGDLADISDAISCQQKAVHLTPEGHADMPGHLNGLGVSLQSRFERTGDLADISDAISCHQKAVHLTPECHADIPSRLNNLGNSLQSRFERTGDLGDISDAISYQQKSVHLTPEGHADMPGHLNGLGVSLQRRFRHTGDLGDISDAISCHQKAVQLTPQGHPDILSRVNNLGVAFAIRFERTGDLGDISDAISCHQKAVHLTPEGHPDMPRYLTNLGHSFQTRFKSTKDFADIFTYLSIDRQCATFPSGPPSIRLKAATRWAQMSSYYDPPQSLEAYNTAIQLVSEVAGLEQTIQKRHTNLLDISDLAASAVACALKYGKADLALEWLEQGRCLVWSQLNILRNPLDVIFAHDPEIARDMLRVSRALENAASRGDMVGRSQGEATMEHKMSLQDEANTHVKLAQEWNELLTKIRTIPKFEDFLRPPSCSNLLKNLPDSGPVVVIIVHKDSCDALALLSDLDEPLHIHLDKFSYAKATDLRNQLNAHLQDANLRMRDCELDDIRATRPVRNNDGGGVIKYILHQLWILVVKPILDGLGFSVSTLDNSAMLK